MRLIIGAMAAALLILPTVPAYSQQTGAIPKASMQSLGSRSSANCLRLTIKAIIGPRCKNRSLKRVTLSRVRPQNHYLTG